MGTLSPYAYQILDLLKNSRVEKLYDVESLFHQWENYVERLSFFNRYPDMTDHGPAHVNNVIAMVAQVAQQVKNGKPVLSPSEVFCLTAAAWLHDIGMYATGDTGPDDVYDAMTIRKRHSVISRDRIREERHIMFPDVPREDVWLISAIPAYHQSRTVLDDAHRKAILERDAKKGKKSDLVEDMPTLEQELASQGWSGGIAYLARVREELESGERLDGEKIRVKLLAALLRLLDQCDIQMNRAGNLDFLVRRVDRSLQQQNTYKQLLAAIPEDPLSRVRSRVQGEVDFFGETLSHYLLDFWIEKTFILDGRIYVKVNQQEYFAEQIELVPESLRHARGLVEQHTKERKHYFEKAKAYIEKELELVQPILAEAGMKMEVLPFPSAAQKQRQIETSSRRRAPHPATLPPVPKEWAEQAHTAQLARQFWPAGATRVLVVSGPPGRGKKQVVRSLLREVLKPTDLALETSVWWNVIEKGTQVADAVHSAAQFLAAHADFALENVFHEESLVTNRHVDFCLHTLQSRENLKVIVLQNFNYIDDAHVWFFRRLFATLKDKLFIATTTRRTSEKKAELLFGEIRDQVGYVESPRLAANDGAAMFRRLLGKKTGKEKQAMDGFVDSWRNLWEAWGREATTLGDFCKYAWLAPKAPDRVEALVAGAARAHFLDIWNRIENRPTWEVATQFITGDTSAKTSSGRLAATEVDAPLADLFDRGLARWEQNKGCDPWSSDDGATIQTTRSEPTGFAWLHPGLRNILTSA